MSEPTPERPTSDDREAWKTYWKAQGMPWRTEPEIDEERRQLLTRLTTQANQLGRGRDALPFRGVNGREKLTRADVEWLLAASENSGSRVSVDWADERHPNREGADLGGADLQGVELQCLPLAASKLDNVLLDNANLVGAHLEYCWLQESKLGGARLDGAHLEHANLTEAHLEGASLAEGHLESSILIATHLEATELQGAHLGGAELYAAHLEGANLYGAHLEHANLIEAHLEGARLDRVHLEDANLSKAHMEGTRLYEAHLERVFASAVQLEGAALYEAHLEGAYLGEAHFEGKRVSADELEHMQKWKLPHFNRYVELLPPADLRGAFLDSATRLKDVTLGNKEFGFVRVVDVHWGGTNLAIVNWAQGEALARPWWSRVTYCLQRIIRRDGAALVRSECGGGVILGDEQIANESKKPDGTEKENASRLGEWQAAVRANRQLAVALREQGLHEQADRFAYRAHASQREVLRLQRQWLARLGSRLLDWISGYGYRPRNSFITYFTVISGFAAIYFILRESVQPNLNPLDAVIFSITSFHGRGFNPGESASLHNPLTIAAAVEAIIGLLIEITFIATFTQRFFAR